jgi:uncharacterized membrane protein YfhO|tara:strand:+ start:2103 stop:2594 length:492 start_codon:yes stop_codon:yes gene_type:complete
MNKKGNFPDVIEWIYFAVAFTMVLSITMLFITNFNDEVQDNTAIPSEAKLGVNRLEVALFSGMDWLFIAIFVIFLAFSVMASRLIPSSPKLIIISIFSIIVLPFLAMIIENVWDGWKQQTAIASLFSNMTFLPFVMDYLVWFTLFYSLAVGIALLSKEGGLGS